MPSLEQETPMTTIAATDFTLFFHELWGCDPFPWQSRLLQRVVDKGWPDFLDLPTASGKTAALDIAVFSLAMQAGLPPEKRTIGRRIFFVVNRRVIVDEAFDRALKLAKKLADAEEGTILHTVAQALHEVSGDRDTPPLDVALLRGGIVRDNRWARSVTQPTIVTSTIDQVGSRLLFRGYGVSEGGRPLHAALVAHDSLLLLDEAHISQPFVETLQAVQQFRGDRWANIPVSTPFAFVQMTATPGEDFSHRFELDEKDKQNPVLARRHGCSKPVELEIAQGAKGKNPHPALAKAIVQHAIQLVGEGRHSIAVVVNRIATARQIAELLPDAAKKAKLSDSEVHLAIGRMRPIDRDRLISTIQQRVGPNSSVESNESPMFVVATQCLEVGADFDFDAMVSECASFDALRQRFGRLNRRGRDIDARGLVIVREDQVNEDDDPIYGPALSKTWQWLEAQVSEEGDTVDFGIHAMDSSLKGVEMTPLLAPRLHAPVMFPAYVDAWAQTSPPPAPDPDVAIFIHGPQRGEPDVQVCWRDDLVDGEYDDWPQIISLCPPSAPECMTVPIGAVRTWLGGRASSDQDRSDLLDGPAPDSESSSGTKRAAVLWRGSRDSLCVVGSRELRPGDTVVLPVYAGGWEVFGHIPGEADKDIAEQARAISAGITVLRMRRSHLSAWPKSEARDELEAWMKDENMNLRATALRALLHELADETPETMTSKVEALRDLSDPKSKLGFEHERYPNGVGVVFSTKYVRQTASIIPAMDDGDDRGSAMGRAVDLPEHLQHVVDTLERGMTQLPVQPFAEALRSAAALHDLGKIDERFQAMLLRGNIHAARARSVPLAKSGGVAMSRQEWIAASEKCGLPRGFRHEMLSTQLAERIPGSLPVEPLLRELALHLIATHHGYGRPFAPVVIDDMPPSVSLEPIGTPAVLSGEERAAQPPHRLDSGIAERFWQLTRQFGWWGLAYLETVLRLADQRASQHESETASPDDAREPAEAVR